MSDFKKKISGFFGTEGFNATVLTALVIAVVLVLNVVLYIVVDGLGLYLYSVENDDLTLSGNTDTLFEEAIKENKKVKISFCFSEDEVKNHDTGAFVYKTANYFAERYSFIELDFINIITKRNKDGELVNMSKYQKDMQGNETQIYKSSVIFECGENYRVVTDTYSTAGFANFFTLDSTGNATSYNGEEVMAGMISWVLHDEHKSAYFTQYHGEFSDIAFSNLLACAGYFVNTVDLRAKGEVPESCDLLIISNPTSDLEKGAEGSGIRSELEKIETYLERGGNLYVALDPNVRKLPMLEAFLSEHGIAFDTVKDSSGKELRKMVKDSGSAITTDGFTLICDYADEQVAKRIEDRVSSYTDGDVIVSYTAALKLSGNARPLLISSPSSTLEAGGSRVDESGKYAVAAVCEETHENGNTSKIFAVPSIYLSASDSLVTDGYTNSDFIYSLLQDFFGAGEMPYGCKAVLYDTATLRNLTMGTAKVYTALILSIPVILSGIGAVIIIRRKNR